MGCLGRSETLVTVALSRVAATLFSYVAASLRTQLTEPQAVAHTYKAMHAPANPKDRITVPGYLSRAVKPACSK